MKFLRVRPKPEQGKKTIIVYTTNLIIMTLCINAFRRICGLSTIPTNENVYETCVCVFELEFETGSARLQITRGAKIDSVFLLFIIIIICYISFLNFVGYYIVLYF